MRLADLKVGMTVEALLSSVLGGPAKNYLCEVVRIGTVANPLDSNETYPGVELKVLDTGDIVPLGDIAVSLFVRSSEEVSL